MNLPKITRDELLEAVKNGVKEALLTMTETGDGYTGPIIRDLFLEIIKQGVENSFSHQIPSEEDIKECIKEGVFNAMPDLSYLKQDIHDEYLK